MNKIKLFLLKIMGFFIPYFKRMLTRQTIIDTVNQMLSSVLSKEGYRHNPEFELTSDQGVHKVISEVQLNCGYRLIIEINYTKGTVGFGFRISEHMNLNNADFLEIAKVSGIIEKGLDTAGLINMFEKYNV